MGGRQCCLRQNDYGYATYLSYLKKSSALGTPRGGGNQGKHKNNPHKQLPTFWKGLRGLRSRPDKRARCEPVVSTNYHGHHVKCNHHLCMEPTSCQYCSRRGKSDNSAAQAMDRTIIEPFVERFQKYKRSRTPSVKSQEGYCFLSSGRIGTEALQT